MNAWAGCGVGCKPNLRPGPLCTTRSPETPVKALTNSYGISRGSAGSLHPGVCRLNHLRVVIATQDNPLELRSGAGPAAFDLDADTLGLGKYIEFFDPHLGAFDAAIGETHPGDPFAQRLDQIHVTVADHMTD